jgi:hypothetical protein
LGAEADGAFIGMTSAAQASTPQEAPPAAMIITAAKMPSFAMRASLAQRARLYVGTKLVGNTEPAPYTVMPENSDPSGGRATVISKGQKGFCGDSCCRATADESQFPVIRVDFRMSAAWLCSVLLSALLPQTMLLKESRIRRGLDQGTRPPAGSMGKHSVETKS